MNQTRRTRFIVLYSIAAHGVGRDFTRFTMKLLDHYDAVCRFPFYLKAGKSGIWFKIRLSDS